MIKNKFNLILIILFSFALNACESVKNAVEGKKRSEQKDEFLVQKLLVINVLYVGRLEKMLVKDLVIVTLYDK